MGAGTHCTLLRAVLGLLDDVLCSAGRVCWLQLIAVAVFWQAFVPARLPRSGTHPELIAFYEAQLGDEEEPVLGQRWFDLCSNNAALEYLSPTSGDVAIAAASGSQKGAETEHGTCGSCGTGGVARGGDTGVQYELLPTLQNVARTCGSLLGAEDAKHWRNLADLADWWNALPITENNGPNEATPRATTRRKLAVVEEMRSFRAPHGEEMLYRQHALLSLLPAASDSSSDSGCRSDNQLKRLSASTGRSDDPYDISFPIHPGAKESELATAAAMESGGGIKLTLEEAHNISAVFHVPAPRPWLHPAQNIHLDALLRRLAGSCTIACPRKDPAANAISAAVLPALLGGRWLEVPVSRDISLGLLSILSARMSKGGELEAATARAVYLALGVSSAVHCQEGNASQQQELSRAKHECALCLALARRMIAELAAAEATASGAECGGALRAATQLRLAKAVVKQATQAVEASVAEATSSTGTATPLLLGTLGEDTAFGEGCALLNAAVAGWMGGWHAKLFAALNWRDRVRLARFALGAGQRA